MNEKQPTALTRGEEEIMQILWRLGNAVVNDIIASTDAYIKHFKTDLPVRFDILTVTGTRPPFHIAHIEDAFFPPIWN